jgi:chromosome condensin MukBEF MukE localization factor
MINLDLLKGGVITLSVSLYLEMNVEKIHRPEKISYRRRKSDIIITNSVLYKIFFDLALVCMFINMYVICLV